MARIIWTEPALQKIDEIADYISLVKPSAAKKLVREVFNRVGYTADHPKSGKPFEEFDVSVYREFVIPPCRVFYRLAEDIIYIIHVRREDQLFHKDILKSH